MQNNELLHYHALEAERRKWEPSEVTLVAQIDKNMQEIVALQEQKAVGESVRQPVKRSEALT